MVIVKFWGGLGNQLFIYSLYKTLQLQGKVVKADISNYDSIDIRDFILEDLDIKLNYVKESDYFKIQKSLKNKIQYIKNKIKSRDYKYFNSYIENGKPFEPAVFDAENTCVLGYWQDPDYFKRFSNEIKKSIHLFHDKSLNAIAAEITNSNSVSIHVRLTDYLTITINGMGHICDKEYYKKSLEIIKEKVDNPKFFIFSDDIENAREMIKDILPSDNVVYMNPYGTIDDMHLMSLCKHHIIANSSYSWWAAFLGDNNPSNVIISPKMWDTARRDWHINLDNWTEIDNTDKID